MSVSKLRYLLSKAGVKVFNLAVQATTPPAPPAGTRGLYIAEDGTARLVLPDGTNTAIGTSSSIDLGKRLVHSWRVDRADAVQVTTHDPYTLTSWTSDLDGQYQILVEADVFGLDANEGGGNVHAYIDATTLQEDGTSAIWYQSTIDPNPVALALEDGDWAANDQTLVARESAPSCVRIRGIIRPGSAGKTYRLRTVGGSGDYQVWGSLRFYRLVH